MTASGEAGGLAPVPDLRDRVDRPVVSLSEDGRPELVASLCRSCGVVAVPEAFVCSNCASLDLRPVSGGSVGTLYSYSTVHVSSSRDTPYTLGYVDLESGARVLADISGDLSRLHPDVLVDLTVGPDGSWSFVVSAGGPQS